MNVDYKGGDCLGIYLQKKDFMDVNVELRFPVMTRDDLLPIVERVTSSGGGRGWAYLLRWVKGCPSTARFRVVRKAHGLKVTRIGKW